MDKFYVQLDGFSRQLVHDYEGVMEKVAKLGYNGIEIFYGLHGGYTPEGLKNFLGSIGMEVISSHVETEDTEENLKYLPGTGCRYMINPGLAITSTKEAYEAAHFLNEMGKKARSVGMKYGYHNHSNDFLKLDGKMICDILIENTDPELVAFEMDIAWAYRADVDAAGYIRKYPGRFELVHVKETKEFPMKLDFMKPIPKEKQGEKDISGWPKLDPEAAKKLDEALSINCELGKGIVDMKAVKAAADAQPCEPIYIVERDYAWTGDIFTTLAADAGYLRAL
ncbi:MAG: sugar phosphate isomerase/epimerase [Acutalibacter sp.]|jgi:sugar phosphate isomerase/epimerase|uniref:sugar phosphate isomerase/epimerase family protein n=1 Tax=Acutalibacter sp. TaxID=1918636 RepID=UPI0021718117|nr:sugar phosphate isomerase/epimerase [Acutalibacter sp.]MCI9225638.1 sugar phosphate isomerase/epimerase [Acutalibacter sp.]